jgi:small-conductance mechanosensitive channel/CRP-like cAMP-binding protein
MPFELTARAGVLHSPARVEPMSEAVSGTVPFVLLIGCLALLWLALRLSENGRRYLGSLALLTAALVLRRVVPLLPAAWAPGLRAVVLLAIAFALVRAAVVSADLVIRRRQAYFSTIFRDIATIVIYGVVVLAVARSVLGIDPTPLFATSALLTVVIGLALQETLGNVFSGLSLQLQKPFEPGDWVRFGTHLGRVQGIGWRSTRLLTRSLELLEVPNALLAKEVITNYRGPAIGDELFIAVSYRTPPNSTKAVILRVLDHNPDVAKVPPPEVLVSEYADWAVRYRIRFWMVEFSRQDHVRDAIMTSLWYALRRSGIEIPYPIRTLYVHDAQRQGHGVEDERGERVTALRRIDFLRELGDDELEILAPSLHHAAFGRGEIVCRESDAGDTLYLVQDGTVEVVARGAAGEEVHIADLSAPAFFGEMSLLTGEPRAATVRAKTDADLLVVEREGFERLFQSRPSVAEAVSRTLATRKVELREIRDHSQPAESADTRSRRLLLKMQAIFGF